MRAAGVMLSACCVLLAGCETAPAPVSERRVEEYRKTAPAPRRAKPATIRADAQPAAASDAGNRRAEDDCAQANPCARGECDDAASTPATTAAKPTTAAPKPAAPKPVPAPEAATATAASTAAASTSKPAASKTAPAEELEGDSRPEFYTVKRGDTVYSIALDAGLDYKELAAWNQLDDANVIRVGQQLRLRPPAGWKPEPAETEGVVVRPAATRATGRVAAAGGAAAGEVLPEGHQGTVFRARAGAAHA